MRHERGTRSFLELVADHEPTGACIGATASWTAAALRRFGSAENASCRRAEAALWPAAKAEGLAHSKTWRHTQRFMESPAPPGTIYEMACRGPSRPPSAVLLRRTGRLLHSLRSVRQQLTVCLPHPPDSHTNCSAHQTPCSASRQGLGSKGNAAAFFRDESRCQTVLRHTFSHTSPIPPVPGD